MKSVTIVSAALVMSALLVALWGCQKQEAPAEHAGNAERAGTAVDNAVESAGDQMKKAGDSVKDATTPDNK
jgi:uncharacterized lipoprotein YehR (DUF1307 family)